MNKISVISALAVGLGLGVVVLGIGCNRGGSSSGSGGTVAVVNGTPITEQEFIHYLMIKPTVQVMSNRGPVDARVAQPLGFQALNELVQQKLVVQMAKDEGVYPSEKDITDEIDFRKETDANFVKNLMSKGLDLGMIKEALAVELSQENLIGKGITVSDADIDAYIKQHPEQFMQPATIDLRWILVKTAAGKKQVDDQLGRAQRFSIVASQFSEAPKAKETQGAFYTNDIKKIPADIVKAVAKIEPLHMTEWVAGANNSGFAKFYVENKTPAKKIDMTPHLREIVRRQVRKQRGENARSIGTQILASEKKSTVEIKMSGLQDTWDAYMKNLAAATAPPSLEKTVEKATGGSTATGTTTGAAPATTSK